MLPVSGADGFGNNLRDEEDEQGDDDGNESEPLISKEQGSLLTHPSRADGVGDGVEGEDSRQGAFGIGFVLMHARSELIALLLAHVDVTERCGHECRLQNRAEERHA